MGPVARRYVGRVRLLTTRDGTAQPASLRRPIPRRCGNYSLKRFEVLTMKSKSYRLLVARYGLLIAEYIIRNRKRIDIAAA